MGSAYGSGSDTLLPNYAAGVQVTNGVPWYGPLVLLDRAAGAVFQIYTPNAAGSMGVRCTNFASNPACSANGYPFGADATPLTVTAAGPGLYTSLPAATLLSFNQAYVIFTPTASGTIYIAVNVRHYN